MATLHDLTRLYGGDALHARRLRMYLAWPVYRSIPADEIATRQRAMRVELVPPPEDVAAACDPPDRFAWARCLTRMRERMAEEVRAYVLIGGRLTNYRGRYHGVVAKAYLALLAGKPVYLAGLLGGAAAAVYDAVTGRALGALTFDHQLAADPGYREFVDKFGATGSPAPRTGPIDYPTLTAYFSGVGLDDLSRSNGLAVEENHRLVETRHLIEVAWLILKRLSALSRAAGPTKPVGAGRPPGAGRICTGTLGVRS